MKAIITTGKSLLNALAFANVNRIDELHAQLDQMNATVDLSASGHSAFAPSIGHIQGAL
jgi:hypothetical protein